MLAAKDERGAIAATLFFNAAHYALRPWPLDSGGPGLTDCLSYSRVDAHRPFRTLKPSTCKTILPTPRCSASYPPGFLGLVVASLIAAFMSTISTQVNWGSSYIVNDFYQRFVNPQATERQLVRAGQISTVGLMVATLIFALLLSNALQAFNILLQVGAGTGLIFILRWFWWRINAYSEIAAMVISFLVALYLEIIHPELLGRWNLWEPAAKLLWGVGITTVGWLTVTFLTPPTDRATLRRFYRLVHPGRTQAGNPSWKKRGSKVNRWKKRTPPGTCRGEFCVCFLGVIAVYSTLFVYRTVDLRSVYLSHRADYCGRGSRFFIIQGLGADQYPRRKRSILMTKPTLLVMAAGTGQPLRKFEADGSLWAVGRNHY